MNSPLLPQDRYIAEILGLTEEEMRWYKAEVMRRAAEGPQPSVVAVEPGSATAATLALISAISSAISIGLSIIATFFAPRPQKRGQLDSVQQEGQTLLSPTSFAPRYGFESVQDIAPLGDPIPRVYAKREFIDGQWYGGVRVNMPLLWSQVWSLGGSQLLRAVFLIGEGAIEKVHPTSFAIGNNTLGAYAFNSSLQRLAVYFRPDGGRIAVGDRISGASAVNDVGARGIYASDIFRVDRTVNSIATDFCGAFRPSTSTSFGVYNPIANGLGYRINPNIRPLRRLITKGQERPKYDSTDDASALAEAWKYKYSYSCKTGIIFTSAGGNPNETVAVDAGDIFELRLSGLSDGVFEPGTKPPVIRFDTDNTDNEEGSQRGDETLISVGAAVAGRQKQYDSSLIEGELYKVGSCLAILTVKTGEFVSEADFGANYDPDEEEVPAGESPVISSDVSCTFQVVKAGTIGTIEASLVSERFFTKREYKPRLEEGDAAQIWQFQTPGLDYDAGEIGRRYFTASSFPQIYRCALGSFSLNRRARYFEIGIKSRLGITVQGICNFADVPSEQQGFLLSAADFIYESVADGTYLAGPRTVTANVVTVTGIGIGMVVSFEVNAAGGITYDPGVENLVYVSGGLNYKEGDIVKVLGTDIGLEVGQTADFVFTVDGIEQVDSGEEVAAPGYSVVNTRAADGLIGVRVKKNVTNSIYSSGSISMPETRYSFFRIGVRDARLDNDEFQDTGNMVFGAYDSKAASVFNFIRFAMNRESNWEIRFEPITSWEIRNLDLTLIALETNEQNSTPLSGFAFEWGTIYCQGRILENSKKTFLIGSLQPSREIGLTWTEGDLSSYSSQDGTYIDFWARVAEFFVYDEISTTCKEGPEHEITYVNVIGENEAVPQYDNMSLVGLNIRASSEWTQFSQFSSYVTGGIMLNSLLGGFGATHLFPDILYDILTNQRYGLGNELSIAQIDRNSFVEAAAFCNDNKFFFDGAKLNDGNWRQWAADVAAAHLLVFIEKGGVFYLEQGMPEFPVIDGIFTGGNALALELQSYEAEQLEPVAISVKFREEKYSLSSPTLDNDYSYGLFPTPREILIYNTDWGFSKTEVLDVSDYCTSEQHAIAAAKYVIAARKIANHSVKIKTTIDAVSNPLSPGGFVKVAMDYTYYNEFNNGVVTSEGKLVSAQSLGDGTYEIIYWDGGSESGVSDGLLVVSDNGTTATPSGIVFTVKSQESLTRTYRIESIQPSEEGFEIEASYSPTSADGKSLIYAEWENDDAWTVLN